MSLHRNLRLRWLRLVRRRLLARRRQRQGRSTGLRLLAHLRDISHGYRQQFGETASETLAKSQRHRN